MHGDLIFCNDKILRISRNINNKRINMPLIDIQHKLNEPDLFVLQLFECNVSVENETTLSDIVLSLKPWAEILSYYLLLQQKKQKLMTKKVFL